MEGAKKGNMALAGAHVLVKSFVHGGGCNTKTIAAKTNPFQARGNPPCSQKALRGNKSRSVLRFRRTSCNQRTAILIVVLCATIGFGECTPAERDASSEENPRVARMVFMVLFFKILSVVLRATFMGMNSTSVIGWKGTCRAEMPWAASVILQLVVASIMIADTIKLDGASTDKILVWIGVFLWVGEGGLRKMIPYGHFRFCVRRGWVKLRRVWYRRDVAKAHDILVRYRDHECSNWHRASQIVERGNKDLDAAVNNWCGNYNDLRETHGLSSSSPLPISTFFNVLWIYADALMSMFFGVIAEAARVFAVVAILLMMAAPNLTLVVIGRIRKASHKRRLSTIKECGSMNRKFAYEVSVAAMWIGNMCEELVKLVEETKAAVDEVRRVVQRNELDTQTAQMVVADTLKFVPHGFTTDAESVKMLRRGKKAFEIIGRGMGFADLIMAYKDIIVGRPTMRVAMLMNGDYSDPVVQPVESEQQYSRLASACPLLRLATEIVVGTAKENVIAREAEHEQLLIIKDIIDAIDDGKARMETCKKNLQDLALGRKTQDQVVTYALEELQKNKEKSCSLLERMVKWMREKAVTEEVAFEVWRTDISGKGRIEKEHYFDHGKDEGLAFDIAISAFVDLVWATIAILLVVGVLECLTSGKLLRVLAWYGELGDKGLSELLQSPISVIEGVGAFTHL